MSRRWQALPAIAAATAAFGCTTPHTDIVATSTESTGAYHVIEARRGDRLFLRACLTKAAEADLIGARLVQQLVNHGYQGIDLELIESAGGDGRGGAAVKMTWSRDSGSRIEGRTRIEQNPCAAEPAHGSSS